MKQQTFSNKKATLFLVATPIGNLEDMSYRGIRILKEVDLIACEDTRNTKILTNHYKITSPLISCHEHNEKMASDRILEVLNSGKNVALVSDAGYPLLSDPGSILIKTILNAGYNVTSIPGPSAFLNALVASNISLDRFTFVGFLDSKTTTRKKQLLSLKEKEETLIFYESVHRIKDTLQNICDIFGNRNACLARELTKKFEEYIRCSLEEMISLLDEYPKGEFVIIVEGNKEKVSVDNNLVLNELKKIIDNGEKSKTAIEIISKKYNIKKNFLYDLYIKNK